MTTETICITKEKYERLQEKAKIDWEIVNKIKKSFEDVKHDRISEIKRTK